MLCEDYFTYEKRANQSGGSPHCRSCSTSLATNQNIATITDVVHPSENLVHILTECSSYLDIRIRIFLEFFNLCQKSKTNVDFKTISNNKNKLCQFLLDPTSLNLESSVNARDPLLDEFLAAIAALYIGSSLTDSLTDWHARSGRKIRAELYNKGKTSYRDMGTSQGHQRHQWQWQQWWWWQQQQWWEWQQQWRQWKQG